MWQVQFCLVFPRYFENPGFLSQNLRDFGLLFGFPRLYALSRVVILTLERLNDFAVLATANQTKPITNAQAQEPSVKLDLSLGFERHVTTVVSAGRISIRQALLGQSLGCVGQRAAETGYEFNLHGFAVALPLTCANLENALQLLLTSTDENEMKVGRPEQFAVAIDIENDFHRADAQEGGVKLFQASVDPLEQAFGFALVQLVDWMRPVGSPGDRNEIGRTAIRCHQWCELRDGLGPVGPAGEPAAGSASVEATLVRPAFREPPCQL